MMIKLGIFPNMSKEGWHEYTRQLVGWMTVKGITPLISDEVADCGAALAVAPDELFSRADMLVVLGGDGTMLSVSENCAPHGLPLIGINLGTLGYLTDVDKKDGCAALEKVLKGEYIQEKRMMLEAAVVGSGAAEAGRLALNDVCVTMGAVSKMITLELIINGEFISSFRADGLILATPTGSTAYNLAAGGPILKPDAEMIAVTPICPHALHSRPWVIPADDALEIRVADVPHNECILSLDGQAGIPVRSGDRISVRKSEYYTTIIKTSSFNFYDVLRMKMMS